MELKKISNGVWQIADTVAEELGSEDVPGATVTRIAMHLGGREDLRARNLAIAALFDESFDMLVDAAAARVDPVTALCLEKSGSVYAREGKLIRYKDAPFLLKKGSRDRGWPLASLNPIAVAAGYGKQEELAGLWAVTARKVPAIGKATVDGIPEYDSDAPAPDIAAVFLLEHPGFGGGPGHGCLFFATDVQPPEERGEDAIVNGYLWVPEDFEGESEHGSFYLEQLRRWGGRLTGWRPGHLTFAQVMEGAVPHTREEAFAFVSTWCSNGVPA